MRLTTIPLKRAAAVLATVCTLGTFCIAGSIAYAGNDTVTTEGANTANIKKQKTSITIHKSEGPEGSTRNDGKMKTIPGTQKPIEGVKFKITRVVKTMAARLTYQLLQAGKILKV